MLVNINFNLSEKGNPDKLSNQEILWNWIQYACYQKYPSTRDEKTGQIVNGMGRTTLRVWGRLQRKFDEVVEEGLKEVELEEVEKDLFKKLFGGEDIKFPPNVAKVILMIQEEVDKLSLKEEN